MTTNTAVLVGKVIRHLKGILRAFEEWIKLETSTSNNDNRY